jgi:RHS repeat-associated protein
MSYLGADQAERSKTNANTFANGLLGLQSEDVGGNKQAFIKDPTGTLVEVRYTGTGAGTYYYVPDGLGSILNLVKNDGTVAATYTYDAWGTGLTVTGTTGVATRNSHRWAGGYLDGTGLYHFGQRFYQPASGRWSQQDSVERPGDPTQGNRYAYTGDDPVNFIDPSGRNWQSALRAFTGGCAKGAAQSVGLAMATALVTGGQVELSAFETIGGCLLEGTAAALDDSGYSSLAKGLTVGSGIYDLIKFGWAIF